MSKIIIETKFNPESHHHEYRARLDANYYLSVNSEEVISVENDLQSMIESELKKGLSSNVYGDIMKEVMQINKACSELKRAKLTDYAYFDHLDQVEKIENHVDNIVKLCSFE